MLGWLNDITKLTLGNMNFRTVAYTGDHAQLTLMRLGPDEEIGWEGHGHLDQFLRLEQGRARVGGTIGQGAALVIWILYEFVVLPDQMLLPPILIGVGLLMVGLSLMPSMRQFYVSGVSRSVTGGRS